MYTIVFKNQTIFLKHFFCFRCLLNKSITERLSPVNTVGLKQKLTCRPIIMNNRPINYDSLLLAYIGIEVIAP